MARYCENLNVQKIYDAATRLLERCLQGEGSLLNDDEELWTLGNLEKLRSHFVDNPDEGDRSFAEKFEDQIKQAGSEICRLAAEIVAVHFLFPSNVGGHKKRELVDKVLGWGGASLPAEGLLVDALSRGIGSGGMGYNTNRPFEIAFVIEFAIAWKHLDADKRAASALDPWKFMETIDSVEGADSRQVRHMLLHILFPDTFERIASREHKRRIVESFKSLLAADVNESVDRNLFAIRGKLDSLLENKAFDFYWPPLVEVWKDSDDSGESTAPMDALRHKKQVVLYGPPGTGKTYRAKRIADRVIRPSLLKKYGPKLYFEKANTGEIENEIRRRIHRLQLHPAYSYEDFVRGLHINGNGATEYRFGYLPKLVERMKSDDSDVPHVLILDEINRTDLSRTLGECFSLLEDRDQEIELPGCDSSGEPMKLGVPENLYIIGTMNLIDQSIEQMDFALRRRFLWVLCSYDGDALVSAAKSRWEQSKCRIQWERVEPDFVRLSKAAEALNREILDSPLLGAQYEIGHTYLLDTVSFLKDDLGPRPQTYLWDKRGKAKRPVQQTWELSLKPLIGEYLSGLDSKSREAQIKRLESVFLQVQPEDD